MIRIPVQRSTAAWSQRTALDGVDYIIDFSWNGRDGAWYINLSAIDGTALVCGIKLVSNRLLLSRFHHIDGVPPGELQANDDSSKIPWAGYDDLSNGVDLLYIEASEVAEARALALVAEVSE